MVEALPVVNLRLMRGGEPDAFFDDQLGAMVSARDDGLISSIGLSNISPAHLRRAPAGDTDRVRAELLSSHEPRIAAGARGVHAAGIAFVPFGSLGFGMTARVPSSADAEVVEQAARLGVTAAQLVLAWTLALAPNLLLIPGASSVDHLRENLAASRSGSTGKRSTGSPRCNASRETTMHALNDE